MSSGEYGGIGVRLHEDRMEAMALADRHQAVERRGGHVSGSAGVFGWYNGDYNYDGKINIDDYGIIDGNIGGQTRRLPNKRRCVE